MANGILVRVALLALSVTAIGASSTDAMQTQGTDAAGARAVVEEIATALEANYVFPDIGDRYAEALRERVDEYASLPWATLPAALTRDLQAVNQDRHLRVVASAPPASGGSGVRVERRVEGGGEGQEAVPEATTPDQLFAPLDLRGLPDIARSFFEDEASRNHFFTKLEVLPGNVGYLDYDQFGFPHASRDAADAAFAFLAEVDAMIIDLRDNRGGIEGMNQYLATHFFGEEPVHLYSRYYRTGSATVEYVTFPDHVQRRFPDVPLFLLVNGGTGSAAENFSFALQGLERATVVGEATAGAAHSSRAFELDAGFLLQLPIARAFNPRTNEDWEGEGVIPQIRVDSKDALVAAHAAAVDALLLDASEDRRLALEDAKLLFGGPDDGQDFDPADYVGEYGTRRVFWDEGRLSMVRTDVEGVAVGRLRSFGAGLLHTPASQCCEGAVRTRWIRRGDSDARASSDRCVGGGRTDCDDRRPSAVAR